MRKMLGIAVVAVSLIGGATVVLAQSSRDLKPPQDPVRSLHPWVSLLCVLAAPAPTMALVSQALVIQPVSCVTAAKPWG